MSALMPGRDMVLGLLSNLLARTLGATPLIVELGSGTGGLAHRIARSRHDATVLALDLDPLLPAIGRRVLGDEQGRVVRGSVDLRSADWWADLPCPVDAVVTVATLHVLGDRGTDRVLRDLAGVLRTGGLLLDLDWAVPEVRDPVLGTALNVLSHERIASVGPSAFSTHRSALRSDPQLAELEQRRRKRLGPPPAVEPPYLDAAGHQRALREAGFADVVELWRHLDLALFAAVR
ncbi:MAG: class I SAM-dependent methyltransferase [Nitriliruptoraceae bacterium]|nr:class I SAM-dependent methyltransferase [Nitriliruptoraceae bacterium]